LISRAHEFKAIRLSKGIYVNKVNLSGYTIQDLDELILDAYKFREKLVEKRRAALIAELEALEALGVGAPAMRAKAPVKYRNAQGETWTGRGNIPRWLRLHEAAGGSRSDLLVKD
jgi:DNA-binding protein H-NS